MRSASRKCLEKPRLKRFRECSFRRSWDVASLCIHCTFYFEDVAEMSREVSQLSSAYILSKYCEAKIFNALRVDFSIKDSYDRKSLNYIVNLNPEVSHI